MKRQFVIILLLGLLVLTACTLQIQAPATAVATTAAPTAAAFGKAWQSTPCETLNIAAIVAAVADCGYVTVPENRAKGGAKTLQLGVVRLKSTAKTPGAPMLVGTGGPGGDEFLFLNTQLGPGINVPSLYAPVLADRDLIYFTQRGTKGAKPELDCPAFDAVGFNVAVKGGGQPERDAQYAATLQACADAFVAQGVDLSAYNTNENAADIRDITQALGYTKIIYYGQSYGTLLGQFLMRDYPDLLEAVILDGIAPVQFKTYAEAFDIPGAFQRLFAACKADATCDANYPNLETTLAAIVAKLQANPQPVEVTQADGSKLTVKIDGVAVMGGLFAQMYNGGAEVPATIYQLKQNDALTLAQFVPSTGGAVAKIMQFAVNCADDLNMSIDEFNFKTMAPLYAVFATDDAMQQIAACKILNVPHLPESADEPVVSKLPVLLFNGALDPATAATNAHLLEPGLPNSQYVLFPGHGHVQAQDPCAVSIMAAFAQNPTAKVDTSCIPPKAVFATPLAATVASADGATAITMTLTAGFKPAAPGQWLAGRNLIFLRVWPAGVSALDALKTAVESSKMPYDAAQVMDGEPVAGQPTKVYRGKVALGGAPFDYDFIAFANKTGAFVIQAYQGDAAILATYRQEVLPALLKTVTVTDAK